MNRTVILLFFFAAFAVSIGAEESVPEENSGRIAALGASKVESDAETYSEARSSKLKKNSFPSIFFENKTERRSIVFSAETKSDAAKKIEQKEEAAKNQSLLLNNDILAYYGHPNSKGMGILGRHTKEELLERLSALSEEYKAVSGGKNIVKAFYIIYATVQPEGRINIIGEERLKEYVDFAAANGMIVFLDHQIGKYDPVQSLVTMLPFLKKYPNVHLALDPEWRTARPMQEIGSISAEEINRAEKIMEDYMIENEIEDERLLVIHQFNSGMIKNRKDVRADFERVRLVLCMDGHGDPGKKRDSYAYNALATNIPIKAFKLFYNEKGNTGVDVPLLTPEEVYALSPRPAVIMYQ